MTSPPYRDDIVYGLSELWPSFFLFAGARREHSIVSPLLQTWTQRFGHVKFKI